jgi:hypothetical protein
MRYKDLKYLTITKFLCLQVQLPSALEATLYVFLILFCKAIFCIFKFKGANSSQFFYENINTINLWLQQVLKNKIP